MTGEPKKLQYQVLVGCAWIDALPVHVRQGDVFRVLKKDGSTYKVALRVLPDIDDSGVYVASADGGESGVSFHVMPPVIELTAPVLDLGD